MRYFNSYSDCIGHSPRYMDIVCQGKTLRVPYAGSKYIVPLTMPKGSKVAYLTMDNMGKGDYSFKLMKYHSDDSVIVASIILSDADYDELMTDKAVPLDKAHSTYDIYLDTIGRYLHLDWMCDELKQTAQEKVNAAWESAVEWVTSDATIRYNSSDWSF